MHRQRRACAAAVGSIVVILAALRPGFAFAQSPCPEGCISFGSGGVACGSAPSVDSSLSTTDEHGSKSYRAVYDIIAGTIVFELAVGPAIYDDDSASVSVTDEFRVTGLPPGGPLTFQARLDVSGEGYNVYVGQHNYAYAQTEIGLREGASNGSSRVYTTSGQGPSTQAVNVTAAPEEPFTLTLFARGRALGYHRGSITRAQGRLVFGNLPPGASVVSCGGYFNDQPVATHKSTWGRLKQLYR